jgi:hypothetical protein
MAFNVPRRPAIGFAVLKDEQPFIVWSNLSYSFRGSLEEMICSNNSGALVASGLKIVAANPFDGASERSALGHVTEIGVVP